MENEKCAYVAASVMENKEISVSAKMLYVTLCTFCEGEDNREFSASVKELRKAFGKTKNTFYKYMHELEEKGIVRKHYVQTGPRPLDRKLHYQLCE
ncbi:MAG: helix-turn-helix domain-containing protein [Lachnospiraceae bacterium]|nr:helix-turn-helix domain-containing protein [Lachnospiraceae bacterium]